MSIEMSLLSIYGSIPISSLLILLWVFHLFFDLHLHVFVDSLNLFKLLLLILLLLPVGRHYYYAKHAKHEDQSNDRESTEFLFKDEDVDD